MRRTNLLAEHLEKSHMPAVARPNELVFRLRNYCIKGLGNE